MRVPALLLLGCLLASGPAYAAASLPLDLPSRATAWVSPVLAEVAPDAAPQLVVLVLDPARVASVARALDGIGLEHHLYNRLAMAGVLLPPALMGTVAQIPGVDAIHPNERMRPLLDRSTDYVGADAVWETYSVTGRGVTVMIMDSGVDGTHPDVAYGKNLVANVIPTQQGNGLVDGSKEGVIDTDADGHGTHVAGIVGGTGTALGGDLAGKYRGVAPGARLIGYQAGLIEADSNEVSFESLTVLEGFNWALENQLRYNIRILSNSWGANGDFDPRSPINIATLNLYKSGFLVLFASGNEGDDGAHTLNKYSVAPWVLSVTAGDYLNDVPDFASKGTPASDGGKPFDHPDLVAPGVGITSTRRVSGLSPLARAEESSFYAGKSGTSMATPHVAGIAALVLEANTRLSPDELMDILTGTATPMAAYETHVAGAGFVNALQAYRLAKKTPGHLNEFLEGSVKYAGPASSDPDYGRDAVSVGYARGAAQRLRSPDTSIAAFGLALVSTPQGLVFVLGGVVLSALALAPGSGPRRTEIVLPARSRPLTPPTAGRLQLVRPVGVDAPPPPLAAASVGPKPRTRAAVAAPAAAPWVPPARMGSARTAMEPATAAKWLRPPLAAPKARSRLARPQQARAGASAPPGAASLRGSMMRAPSRATAAKPATSSLVSSSKMRGKVERVEG